MLFFVNFYVLFYLKQLFFLIFISLLLGKAEAKISKSLTFLQAFL